MIERGVQFSIALNGFVFMFTPVDADAVIIACLCTSADGGFIEYEYQITADTGILLGYNDEFFDDDSVSPNMGDWSDIINVSLPGLKIINDSFVHVTAVPMPLAIGEW